MRNSSIALKAAGSPAPKAPNRRGKVQSATAAVEVLKALAGLGGAASLTVLATRLQENPAKVHRYLASLCESEFVVQEQSTARYVLGPESIAIGLAAMRQSDVLELTGAELARLAHSHDLSCFVSVLGSHGPTVVRLMEPLQAVTVNVKAGSVMPVLWSATGRAFGAFARSRVLDHLVLTELQSASAGHRRELPDQVAVDALFEEIRALGGAPVTGTLMAGISAVAFPIFSAQADLAAVITALGPSGSFDPTPGGRTSLIVRAAADSVSRRLGYRAPALGIGQVPSVNGIPCTE